MSNTINKSASRQRENLGETKKRAVNGSDEKVAQTGGCLLC